MTSLQLPTLFREDKSRSSKDGQELFCEELADVVLGGWVPGGALELNILENGDNIGGLWVWNMFGNIESVVPGNGRRSTYKLVAMTTLQIIYLHTIYLPMNGLVGEVKKWGFGLGIPWLPSGAEKQSMWWLLGNHCYGDQHHFYWWAALLLLPPPRRWLYLRFLSCWVPSGK